MPKKTEILEQNQDEKEIAKATKKTGTTKKSTTKKASTTSKTTAQKLQKLLLQRKQLLKKVQKLKLRLKLKPQQENVLPQKLLEQRKLPFQMMKF